MRNPAGGYWLGFVIYTPTLLAEILFVRRTFEQAIAKAGEIERRAGKKLIYRAFYPF